MSQKCKVTFSIDFFVEGNSNDEVLDKAEDMLWEQIEEMEEKGERARYMWNTEIDREVKEPE